MGTLKQAFEVARTQMLAHFGEVPQCDGCARLHDDRCTCDVFPDVIPAEIFTNGHDHREPFPGDSGLRFVPGGKTGERGRPGKK